MSEQSVWSSDQDVFNMTVSRDKCSGVVYWGCMRDFFKSATAAVMLSAVCATSLYAGEGSEPAANDDFGGHRFNVSSGLVLYTFFTNRVFDASMARRACFCFL